VGWLKNFQPLQHLTKQVTAVSQQLASVLE
jgi:hypothetical protein